MKIVAYNYSIGGLVYVYISGVFGTKHLEVFRMCEPSKFLVLVQQATCSLSFFRNANFLMLHEVTYMSVVHIGIVLHITITTTSTPNELIKRKLVCISHS